MKMKQLALTTVTIVFLLFLDNIGKAESYDKSNQNVKDQTKLLVNVNQFYSNLNCNKATNCYDRYLLARENENKNRLINLADSYFLIGKYETALSLYELLFPVANEGVAKQIKLRIAELYARFHDYERASMWLKLIDGFQAKANAYMDDSRIKLMKKDSMDWHISFLDINTQDQEFSPFLKEDVLYFSSNRDDGEVRESLSMVELDCSRLWKVSVFAIDSRELTGNDLCQNRIKCRLDSVNFKPRDNDLSCLIKPLCVNGIYNSRAVIVDGFEDIRYNIAPVSIDMNDHFYFSTNYRKPVKSSLNRLCLMEGVCNRNGYLKIKILPFGDCKTYSVMHPTINSEGTLLIFASDKPDGLGGYDLYYAKRKDIRQSWGECNAFNSTINSMGNEVFPTITSDGYLYYSSDAMPGLGGLDIFRVLLKDAINGTANPEHLSYPINSSADDFGWTQDSTNVRGYFTSDRLGDSDIYSFYYKKKL